MTGGACTLVACWSRPRADRFGLSRRSHREHCRSAARIRSKLDLVRRVQQPQGAHDELFVIGMVEIAAPYHQVAEELSVGRTQGLAPLGRGSTPSTLSPCLLPVPWRRARDGVRLGHPGSPIDIRRAADHLRSDQEVALTTGLQCTAERRSRIRSASRLRCAWPPASGTVRPPVVRPTRNGGIVPSIVPSAGSASPKSLVPQGFWG